MHEKTHVPNYYDSLLALFADNFCKCLDKNCKQELTNQLQQYMKLEFSKKIVNDFINIISGTSKSGKLVNIMAFLLKSLSIHNISKELMDDLIGLFMMLYLKSNETLKLALLTDLENAFMLVKQKETAIFVDKKFVYKILFYNLF
jgi:predicted amino acid-binding ACT domain protein